MTYVSGLSGDSTGIIEGYASLFNVDDSEQDVIAPGAFDASLKAWVQNGRSLPLLWQHDVTQPLGKWLVLKPDAKGLFVRGQLFIHEVKQAAEAYALVKRGALTGLSIGYRAEQARRDAGRGLRVLERVKLYEISLVTFPALEAARVSAVKASQPDPALVAELRRFSSWLGSATSASH
jgi:HK97 family phage prohead protease